MTLPQDHCFNSKSNRLNFLADREGLLPPPPVNQTIPSSIMKTIVCAILVLLSLAASPASVIVNPWVPIFKGIDHATGTETNAVNIYLLVNALRIDLHDPDVQMFTDPPCTNCTFPNETIGYSTSSFLKTYGVQVAVNANFYNPCCFYNDGIQMDVIGLSISKGRVVSAQEGPSDASNVMFTTNKQVIMISTTWPPTNTTGIYTAVSGHYPLVTNGVNFSYSYTNDTIDIYIHQRQPRTAAGVSQDGRYLYLITIDGRQSGSDGAIDPQTADWLIRFGSYNGINLDGGGSTTMVMADCAGSPIQLNIPIDQGIPHHERVIGNHLGVFAKPLPGFINDLNVIPASTTATISWTTVSNATTQIAYGLGTNYDALTPLDSALVTSHSVTLSGLAPGTNYYFQAISTVDAARYTAECYFETTNHFVMLFDFTQSWQYTTNNLNGIKWQLPAYTELGWLGQGPGLLYIETNALVSPRNTPLPGVSGALPPTYYFRTHFTFTNRAAGVSLLFSNFIDDGAVFYLNGVEIQRVRLPAAPTVITYTTLTTTFPCTGDATCPDVFTISGDLITNLVTGDNVLAAEVHQVSTTSSDIVFGSALFSTAPSSTTASNSPPTLSVPPTQTINELATLIVTNTATDPEIATEMLTFSLVSAPGNATLDPATGVLTWTPTEAQGPSTNVITVRVTDNGSPPLSDTKSFTIIVNEVNSAPTLTVPPTQTINELTTLSVTNTATDPDIPANTLTFALVAGPSGMTLDLATGVLTWTPTEAQGPSTNVITVRVTDNGTPPLSDTKSFTVIVNEVNSAPTLTVPPTQTINELTTLTVTNVATDPDIPANTLTFALVAGPSGMTLDSATGVLAWPPSDTKSFTVIVNEVNSAPVLAPITDKPVTEGSLLTFTAIATDADIPANSLTFTLDPGAPAGATINATNGVFTWTPPNGFSPATNTVTIRVTDDGSPPLSDANTFKIVVASAPRIMGITLSSASAVTITWQAIPGKTYRVQSTASLASGAWTPVGSDLQATDIMGTITEDTSSADQRFYRVMQLD